MEVAGQIVGIVAMCRSIGSMQCKSIRNLYAVQFLGSLLWALSYLLLGSPAGAVLNVFSIIRALVLMGKGRWRHPSVLAGLLVLWAATSVVSFYTDGWLGLLPIAAQLAGTLGMWTRNSAKLRIAQIFLCSPAWLTFNVLVGAWGGVLCESFTMISVIVSFIRFGWRALLEGNPAESDKNAKKEAAPHA